MNAVLGLEGVIAAVRACYACGGMDHCHVLGGANGRVSSRVMFVGEAPGRLGAGRSGVPFSGDESGRRFERLLAEAGLQREAIFVTNAVLCNPLDGGGRNRRPSMRELERCSGHLRAQIDAVAPALVVALGRVALQALGRIEPHGLSLADCGRAASWYGRLLLPLYHPGRRAIVHRAEHLQVADWRALGEIIRVLPSRSADAV